LERNPKTAKTSSKQVEAEIVAQCVRCYGFIDREREWGRGFVEKGWAGVRLWLFACLILLALLSASCTNDGNCHANLYVEMQAGFYTNRGDTAVVGVTMDSIWVKGIGNDSVIYNNMRSVSFIQLPLQKLRDTTSFAIRFNNIYDTLTCTYTNTQQYVSLECGCMVTNMLHTVTFTKHAIDSCTIIHPNVINQQIENLKIYF